MKKLLTLFFLIASMATTTLMAQEKTITGVVKDQNGQGLPGVNVVIKGTTMGVATEVDGSYTITAKKGDVLQYSFIEMKGVEITVGDKSNITFAMEPETFEMEVLQVVGYGSQKKKDIIGAVTTVKADDLTKMSTSTVAEGLQGNAAGVNVQSSDGMPGSSVDVKIRGIHSVSLSNKPLWIIDGMPVVSDPTSGQDPLSLINSNDIESMEILKDAKATSIYGSRGSNGVIIITTKSGKNNKDKIKTNLSYTTGISQIGKNPEKMGFANTQEYFNIADKARENSGLTEYDPGLVTQFFTTNALNPIAPITREEALANNTDWFKEVLRTGVNHDFNVSSTGGGEKGSFYYSLNYKDIKGIIKNNDMTSLSGRVNLDYQLFKGFTIAPKLSFGYTDNYQPRGGNGQGGSFGNAYTRTLPWFPTHNADHASGYWNPLSGYNIPANMDKETMTLDKLLSYRAMSSVALEYAVPWKVLSGLKIRSESGFDFIQSNNNKWTSVYLNKDGSKAESESNTRRVMNTNLYASYYKKIGQYHNVDFTIGTEYQADRSNKNRIVAEDLTTVYHEVGNPNAPALDPREFYAYLSGEDYLRSYFGRLDYKFKDKYIVGTSFRRDGSSKFKKQEDGSSKNPQFADFAAFSLGWLLSEESFFRENFAWFSVFKLRGSFGQTGNKNIDAARFANVYNNKLNDLYATDEFLAGATLMKNLGNPGITWETTSSKDVGIDWSGKKNKFQGSVAFYHQLVSGLLLETAMPPSAPVSTYWANVGSMRNAGVEFSISAIMIDNPITKFKWTTDFNFTYSNNKFLEMAEKRKINGAKILIPGEAVGTFYLAESAGVDPETGLDMIYEIDQDAWKNENKIVKTGNIIPATQTNYENNKVILSNQTEEPTYFGGLNNKFENVFIKGLDFGFKIFFSGGNYQYDYIEQRAVNGGNGQYNYKKDLIDETWTPDNKDAKYPELVWQYTYPVSYAADGKTVVRKFNTDGSINPEYSEARPMTFSYEGGSILSRYLYKADFIRLKSIEVGYNFPKSFVENKLKLTSLRFYASANNIAVFSPYYKGWDPETGERALPPPRIFSFGINVGL